MRTIRTDALIEAFDLLTEWLAGTTPIEPRMMALTLAPSGEWQCLTALGKRKAVSTAANPFDCIGRAARLVTADPQGVGHGGGS